MKSIFKTLDPACMKDDAIAERLDREPEITKQINFLGFSMIITIITTVIMLYCIMKSSNTPPRPTFALSIDKEIVKNAEEIDTLPVPHQSLDNVSGWLLTALNTIYGVSFDNIDDKIEDAAYFFTDGGYKAYLKAVKDSGFRDAIVDKKLKITLLATQKPVLINSGSVGNLEFWRLRVPVLISYLGGKDTVTSQKMVEVLIIRVPAYQNEKGLAISEFIMGQM